MRYIIKYIYTRVPAFSKARAVGHISGNEQIQIDYRKFDKTIFYHLSKPATKPTTKKSHRRRRRIFLVGYQLCIQMFLGTTGRTIVTDYPINE